jgi:hypothetical protein
MICFDLNYFILKNILSKIIYLFIFSFENNCRCLVSYEKSATVKVMAVGNFLRWLMATSGKLQCGIIDNVELSPVPDNGFDDLRWWQRMNCMRECVQE